MYKVSQDENLHTYFKQLIIWEKCILLLRLACALSSAISLYLFTAASIEITLSAEIYFTILFFLVFSITINVYSVINYKTRKIEVFEAAEKIKFNKKMYFYFLNSISISIFASLNIVVVLFVLESK